MATIENKHTVVLEELSLEEAEIVYLSVKFKVKKIEYAELCKQLDELKAGGVDPNDERLSPLLAAFRINNEEIVATTKRLKELAEPMARAESTRSGVASFRDTISRCHFTTNN